MNTTKLMYGNPREVSNELCAANDPENTVLHSDLIAALGNALNRIAGLEEQLAADRSEITRVASIVSCLANGIIPNEYGIIREHNLHADGVGGPNIVRME